MVFKNKNLEYYIEEKVLNPPFRLKEDFILFF